MDPKLKKVLAETGWLSQQPKEFCAAWLDACEHRSLAAGEHLYSLGDPPGGIYGIAEGFGDVLLTATPFPPFLVYIARAGWWVGEAAAVTGSPRRVEIRARTQIEALYIAPLRLEQIAAANPETWRYVAQLTVSHMDNALMLASSLVKGDPGIKVLTTLVRLAGAQGSRDETLFLPCTQQELGEMVGLSRNSVGPVLADLEQRGLISREVYGQIAYNPSQLKRALER